MGMPSFGGAGGDESAALQIGDEWGWCDLEMGPGLIWNADNSPATGSELPQHIELGGYDLTDEDIVNYFADRAINLSPEWDGCIPGVEGPGSWPSDMNVIAEIHFQDAPDFDRCMVLYQLGNTLRLGSLDLAWEYSGDAYPDEDIWTIDIPADHVVSRWENPSDQYCP